MRLLLFFRDLTDRLLGPALHRYLRRTTGFHVASGPFCGLHYVQTSFGSMFFAKIIGSYEKELHPVFEELIALQPTLLVDVGCAEGYYAVGMAVRLPKMQVVAFEMEEEGRRLARSLADLNHVSDRVQVEGHCYPEDLAKALSGFEKTVVICDTEGYEATLLTASAIRQWPQVIFVVETHDFLQPGVTEQLRQNFSATHEVRTIAAHRRRPEDLTIKFPWWLSIFGPKARTWCLSERRAGGMQWIYATPLSKNADGGK